MRLLASLLLLPGLALGQGITTLNNGDPADANTVNTNFQNLDSRIQAIEDAGGGGGCSATQQGNNVLVECVDGTSGVIAGAGVVVVYPEGQIGNVPPIEIPSGDFALVDANGEILARSRDAEGPRYLGFLGVNSVGTEILAVTFVNDEATGTVLLYPAQKKWVYYLSDDCTGDPLVTAEERLLYLDGFGWGVPAEATATSEVLIGSRIYTGNWYEYLDEPNPQESCNSIQAVIPGITALVSYYLPEAVLNAAYPVRLEQLP